FVGFLDHDDELKPNALFEVVQRLSARRDLDYLYSDEDKVDPNGWLSDAFFKPDWSPDVLLSVNYIAHLTVIRRSLVQEVGGFRDGFDGSQDFDLFLRTTEYTQRIAHIPKPLYTWRMLPESTAATVEAKPYADTAGKRALADALRRRGQEAQVLSGCANTFYQVRYGVRGTPRVCVIIPTRDRVDLVQKCVDSLSQHTTYKNYEILIVDNESVDEATLRYLNEFDGRVVRYPHRFNYARMMNLAALEADADYLLMLNNDAEVRSDEWIERLLEHAQRPEVGIVGARLLFPDDRPQHEGIVLGVGGVAYNLDASGYFSFGDVVRDCSGVTGACLMTRHNVFWEVGGFEERLRVAYNDVDFCLRVGELGYRIIYTPYLE
ncbi:MAG: glycosyltransferase family 2 protein, partial [Vicinamibacterales bacterium]